MPLPAAALSALAGVGNIALDAVTNRGDVERLNELRRRRKTGQLGLQDSERQRMHTQRMAGTKQAAAESQSRGEGTLAALGRTRASDVARLGRETTDTLSGAEERTTDYLHEQDKAAELANRQELEARNAAQQAKFAAIAGKAGESLSGITSALGEEQADAQAQALLDDEGKPKTAGQVTASRAAEYGLGPEVGDYANQLVSSRGMEGALAAAQATRKYMETGEVSPEVDMELAKLLGYDPQARARGLLGTPNLMPGTTGFDNLDDVPWDELAL